MAKVVRTLREHWKKSTFLGIVGYFGINYAYERHKTFMLMREYSKQAQLHGKRRLPAGAKNKHITLLLNPTAGNRKANGRLEKYAEPLLHLAGFLVSKVKTERIDEAKDLVGIIERTNVIAVAGGDGTVFETVTGLLRRQDADDAVARYPIGILPVGSENKLGKRLFGSRSNDQESRFIAEAAMAIINHRIRPVDVMEIQITDTEPETESQNQDMAKGDATEAEEPEAPASTPTPRKPFYSLVGLNMGQFREAKKIKDDMPSFLGQFFTTFWSLFRMEPFIVKAQLNYIPSCDGCSKCKLEEKLRAEEESKRRAASSMSNKGSGNSSQSSIWSRLTSVFSRPVLADTITLKDGEEDSQQLPENPECGVQKSLCVETSELNVVVCGGGRLKVEIGGRLEKTDYMIEGLKRLKGEAPSYKMILDCREIEICPVEGQAPEYFSIDNEEFEVKRVKLRAIKDRINLFVP